MQLVSGSIGTRSEDRARIFFGGIGLGGGPGYCASEDDRQTCALVLAFPTSNFLLCTLTGVSSLGMA
jgi:hypothetical protein